MGKEGFYKNILGYPPRAHNLVDPGEEIFNETFATDGFFISLTPGKPVFFKDTNEYKKQAKEKNIDINESDLEIDSLGSDGEIEAWLKKNIKNSTINRDLRYYGFQNSYTDYFKYVRLLTETVAIKMNVRRPLINSIFSDVFSANAIDQGLNFYLQQNSSVSESISNEYGASALEGMSKTISDYAKEAAFLLGLDGKNNSDIMQSSDDIKKIQKEQEDGINNLLRAGRGVKEALGGGNILFPEIWRDSKFTRSYNLNFLFKSVYGTPECILRSVYIPFLALIALALPRQNSTSGYYAPFLVRADTPGLFMTDMGVITDISFKKGGPDGLFSTQNGLPLEIEVNVTLKDLYPTLMMTTDMTILRQNFGLAGFLDNMAGLNFTRINPLKEARDNVYMRMSSVTAVKDRAENWIEYSIFKTLNDITDKFRY